ncbi:MAG: stage II sporulation protein M [Firmicutes bacterium]|jgi:stage II sporulation protein M|nr:stage II sporulation protein M [Bacillota bacterium]
MVKAGTFSELVFAHVRSNIVTYSLLFAVFLTGICFGAVYASILREGSAEVFEYLETGLLSLRRTLPEDHTPAVSNSLAANLNAAAIIWALGVTVVGLPGIFVVLFVRGFSAGFTVAFMVREMAAPGVAAALASVLPHNVLAVPALLIVAAASSAFSWSVVKKRLLAMEADPGVAFAKSAFAAGAAALLLVLASFVQVYVSPALLVMAARFAS